MTLKWILTRLIVILYFYNSCINKPYEMSAINDTIEMKPEFAAYEKRVRIRTIEIQKNYTRVRIGLRRFWLQIINIFVQFNYSKTWNKFCYSRRNQGENLRFRSINLMKSTSYFVLVRGNLISIFWLSVKYHRYFKDE